MSRVAWPYNPKTLRVFPQLVLPDFIQTLVTRLQFISREIPLTQRRVKNPPSMADSSKNAELALKRHSHAFPGGHSGVVPPDPIPNSEVKRACADGSVALPCKSRSPPGALSLEGLPIRGGLRLYGVGRCRGDRRSQAATDHRQGLYLKHPHRQRWGCFFGRRGGGDRRSPPAHGLPPPALFKEGLPIIRGGLRLCGASRRGHDVGSQVATGHRHKLHPGTPSPVTGGVSFMSNGRPHHRG